MRQIESSQQNSNSSVLDQLVWRIRIAHQGVQLAFSNALESALEAGAAINDALDRGATMAWVCGKCGLKTSTAYLYRQLSQNRAVIDAARERRPHFSVRDARRLIAKPKVKPSAKTASITASSIGQVMLAALRDSEWTAALNTLGFARFLRVMPPLWRAQLQQRAGGQAIEQLRVKYPDTRMKRLRRRHLELVHDVSDAPTQH